jgi:hypothetical protein
MKKIWEAAKDWWAVMILLVGAAISAYDVISQIQTKGNFSPSFLFVLGLILFFIFTTTAVIKVHRDARDKVTNTEKIEVQKSPSPATNSIGAGHDVKDSPVTIADRGGSIVAANGQGKAAGRDIVENHHYYYTPEKKEPASSPKINIEISYFALAETIDEKRAEHQTHRSIRTRRLPYSIKNEGDVGIKECRIKMTSLLLRDPPNNYYSDTTNLPIDDNSIQWKNSDKERIDLGIGSNEPIILAKIPDYNAIPIFHFVVFGDDKKNLNEKVARVFEGTWDVGLQVEGKVENNGIIIDLVPIRYTISFRFESFSLIPLEVKKHE